MTDAAPHRLHRAWRATVYEADGIAVQIARDPRQPTLWRGRAAAVATSRLRAPVSLDNTRLSPSTPASLYYYYYYYCMHM